MDNLSTEMDSGHPGPRGVTDEDLFMHWLRRATDNDVSSMAPLGDYLAEGLGVEASPEHAVFWWRCGAELGCPQSMMRLGAAYENGFGVPIDIDAAIAWHRMAAEHRDPQAMAYCGAALANYRWDDETAQAEALKIARVLVDQGVSGARTAMQPLIENASDWTIAAALSDPLPATLN